MSTLPTKLAFVMAFVAFCVLAGEARAVTVLTTTQQDVKAQCVGKTSCMTGCGSTLCDYVCDDPKKQCTVAVFIKRTPGTKPLGGADAAKAETGE
ncbi:hypothetical protein [Rhodopila sp.]|uniref:hypothetical protein n=1 Tax=Rhodopila sp. TaxID=2480087 RepID=UPI003D0E6EF9